MSELERSLRTLASEIEWPQTPHVRLELAGRARPRRVPRLAAAVVLIAIAIGVAFAVPQARSAILRFFHLGGVTIERVGTLPSARERALTAGLGTLVTRSEGERALVGPVRLPPVRGQVHLYQLGEVISTVLSAPQPVLLSEMRFGGTGLLPTKLIGPTTKLERTRVVAPGDAYWISGGRHVYVFPPAAPKLAGNVLLWSFKGITFRLEGRTLKKAAALRVAREISH